MTQYSVRRIKVNANIKQQKKMPVWAMIIIDVLLIGCVLIVFAYFHHVLPQESESLGIVIERPTKTASPVISNTPVISPSLNETNQEPVDTEPVELTWAQKFAEHFSDTVVETDTSYKSPNISITITTTSKGSGGDLMKYYVADVYVTDIEYLQTYFAKGKFGTGYRQYVLDMDKKSGAILAVSGDFYGNSKSTLHGVVIRNGTVYRTDKTKMDTCVLYYDGTLETYLRDGFDAEEVIARAPYHAWTFGPALLDEEGKALEEFNSGPKLSSKNPRCGIGYFEPGHYCFIVVDGRTRDSKGATMDEFAAIFEELGCAAAYNLDGGASAMMTFDDKLFTNPPDESGRTISDCIIIVEEEE